MRFFFSRFVCLGVVLAAAFGCGRSDAQTVEITTAPSDTVASRPASDQRGVVLCLGDSLTAGYGLLPEQAYPVILQQRVDERGWPFHVVNAGLSGETTSAGLRRVDWLMNQWDVHVLVLALGGNDGLRGIGLDTVRANLAAIIDRARERRPDVDIVLAGIQPPPNMGPDYTEAFKAIYPELARDRETALVPSLIADVGGVASMNQSDGIHPTAEGQQLLARNVWAELESILDGRVESGEP